MTKRALLGRDDCSWSRATVPALYACRAPPLCPSPFCMRAYSNQVQYTRPQTVERQERAQKTGWRATGEGRRAASRRKSAMQQCNAYISSAWARGFRYETGKPVAMAPTPWQLGRGARSHGTGSDGWLEDGRDAMRSMYHLQRDPLMA